MTSWASNSGAASYSHFRRQLCFTSCADAQARPTLMLERAVDVAQRLLATVAVAGVIGVARLIHGLGDRLDLLCSEIARLLFGAGDRPQRRLAMHSRERR